MIRALKTQLIGSNIRRQQLSGAAWAGALALALAIPPALAAQPEPPRVGFGVGPGAAETGEGAPIGQVIPGGTAAAIGMQQGDLVTEANGRPIKSHADMIEFVRTLRIGDPLSVTVKRGGQTVRLTGTAVAGPAAGPVMRFRSPEMAALAMAPVTRTDARTTAQEFARLLEENFYDARVAKRYAAALRANAASGAYDQVGTVMALAQKLTADAQAVAPDGHLRIMPAFPQAPGAGAPNPAGAGGAAEAVEEARWLAPGIAYIRFNGFPSTPETIAATEKFMRDHADAETIIFDLRTNGGGSTDETQAVMRYLFAKETALVRRDIRTSVLQRETRNNPLDPYDRVVGTRDDITIVEQFVRPHPTERRLTDARVFVLTSGYTASAAEAFAVSLKGTRRATLIGETTAGAGNSAFALTPVGERFRAFIPSGHAYDPRSGQGWEGTGVVPDVRVPAEEALTTALVRSGLDQAEAERLSRSVHPQGPMQRPQRQQRAAPRQ